MTLPAGVDAPDFTLPDQHGRDVTLSTFRGTRPVVVVFYPFTFTSVCEGELCELRDDPAMFESADAQVLAISCDPVASQRTWAEQHGFEFPVLSDFWPHGAVARAYDAFDESFGAAIRATFVVDREGRIAATFTSQADDVGRTRSDYEAALSEI